MNNRTEYIALQDFTAHIPSGNFTMTFSYKKGDTMNLRKGAPRTEEWINNGYVQERTK